LCPFHTGEAGIAPSGKRSASGANSPARLIIPNGRGPIRNRREGNGQSAQGGRQHTGTEPFIFFGFRLGRLAALCRIVQDCAGLCRIVQVLRVHKRGVAPNLRAKHCERKPNFSSIWFILLFLHGMRGRAWVTLSCPSRFTAARQFVPDRDEQNDLRTKLAREAVRAKLQTKFSLYLVCYVVFALDARTLTGDLDQPRQNCQPSDLSVHRG